MHPQHEVYWYTQKKPTGIALKKDIVTDVAIVGGGMAGLMCALRLHRLGKKVVVIERYFCGAGASGKSSGFITPDSELSLGMLLERFPEEKARRMWEFVTSGVEQIREVIEEFALPCDYEEQDCLFVAKTAAAYKDIVEEHEARQRLGLPSRLYSQKQMPEVLGADTYFGGVRYGGTYGVNAYLFCQELKAILEGAGVHIFENTAVRHIASGLVQTSQATVRAKQVIVCTDRYLPELRIAASSIYSAQTFLGLSQPLTKAQIKKIFPEKPCLTWDSDLVYHYFRIADGNRLLIGGSNVLYTYLPWRKRHVKRVERKLVTYVREHFPEVPIELEYFWSGMLGVSRDFLPIAGECPDLPGVYYVGGATGLPWAAALGTYMADRMVKGAKTYDSDFTARRRFPLGVLVRLLPKPLAFALSHGIAKLG